MVRVHYMVSFIIRKGDFGKFICSFLCYVRLLLPSSFFFIPTSIPTEIRPTNNHIDGVRCRVRSFGPEFDPQVPFAFSRISFPFDSKTPSAFRPLIDVLSSFLGRNIAPCYVRSLCNSQHLLISRCPLDFYRSDHQTLSHIHFIIVHTYLAGRLSV